MADPVVQELEATTKFYLWPKAVTDNFFRSGPFMAHLRQKALTVFPGGLDMRYSFVYAPMIGGAYTQGSNFNITKPSTITSAVFDPKFYEVNITEYLEQIRVQNVGPDAAFSLIENDLNNAMSTISAIVAIALHRDGQTAGRIAQLNGWTEAYNDGITPDWTGQVYANYGKQPRNGTITDALNSIPRWGGDANGNTAPVSYQLLEETYQDSSRGDVEPDLGVSNKRVFAGIKNRIQPQQRFAQEKDPVWGVTGMRINSAIILKDDYFPSLAYGQNDAKLGNYLTSTFAVPAGASSLSNLPVAGTVVTVGEVFNWFNTSKWLFYVARDPLFAFGFTGFKPAQDTTRVSGQVLAMVNTQCRSPWSGKSIYGLSA